MAARKKIIIIIAILLGFSQAGLFFWFLSEKQERSIDTVAIKKEEAKTASDDRGGNEGRVIDPDFVYGGILPHHLVVQDKIEEYLGNLEAYDYERIVLICPNHLNLGPRNLIVSDRDWPVKEGVMKSDRDYISRLVPGRLEIINQPFLEEASVNALLPLLAKHLPQTQVVPILVKVDTKPAELIEAADNLAKAQDQKKTLVLASVDFSHYLSRAAAEFHDLGAQAAIKNFDLDKVGRLEVDSPPALILFLDYLRGIGAARSELWVRTDSGQEDAGNTSHNFFYFRSGEPTSIKANSFLFFGDLMLDRYVRDRYGKDFSKILEAIKGEEGRFLKGVDLVAANLEGAVVKGGEHLPPALTNDFSFAPEDLKTFQANNFNFFNIANNHLADQGSIGIASTREKLAASGFNYSGCVNGQIGDCTYYVVKKNNRRLAMVGLSMVYKEPDLDKLAEILSQARKEADLVIANIHWGREYDQDFSQSQTKIAHFLIDHGVDIIIGHHPHVIQGIEVYKDRPIFYSLGNFVFDQYFSAETEQGLAVGIDVTDKQLTAFLFPFKLPRSRPELLRGQDKTAALAGLARKSPGAGSWQTEIGAGKISIILK